MTTGNHDELLCEHCGYVLDGLSESSKCPECGTPVASSLPSAREGSAWQQRPGTGSWLRTLGSLASSPQGLFGRVRPTPTWGLLAVNLGLSAVIVMVGGVIWEYVSGSSLPSLYELSNAVLIGLGAAAGFGTLTWIEMLGVGLWRRRSGRRLPPGVAWCICSHASYGWLISGLLAAIGWAIAPRIHHWMTSQGIGWIDGPVALALLVVPGVFLGMLVFETLVYLGVRRCRFINVPRLPRPDRVASSQADSRPASGHA